MDFFSKVYAQSADDVAKSTIPFTAPGVTSPTPFPTSSVTTSPTPALEPSIYLETTVNQLRTSETVNVKIRINTVSKTIKSFKFVVKYDPDYFQISDALPDVANVQISYNDLFFINDVNEVDTSTGTISINAATTEGSATISGRVIAEFNLTTKKEGFSQVALVIADSSLLDSNNTDILKNTGNPLDFVISNTQVTVVPTTTAPTPTGNLPKNGIFDELGAANSLIAGVVLISIGAYLYKMQKNAKKKL